MSSDSRCTPFRQFNHGTTTMAFGAATPPKRDFIRRVMRSAWGIGGCEGISKVMNEKGAKSNNYRIESNGRKYFLKEGHPANPAIRDISNKIISFCETRGARAPHVRLTRHGWTYYGLRCILSLYNFIEGENFDGSRAELKEAAIRLAQLDKALAVSPSGAFFVRERGVRKCHSARDAKSLFEIARLRGARNGHEGEFLSALNYLEEASASLSSEVPCRLPFQLIHGNVHPHNVVFSPEGRLLAFVDFETVSFSQRAREVAFAMHRLARAYGEGTERNNDAGAGIRERAEDFLSAYNSENPLREEEVRALGFLLRDEALSRVLTVLRNYYAHRQLPKEGHFEKRLTMLQETELLVFP